MNNIARHTICKGTSHGLFKANKSVHLKFGLNKGSGRAPMRLTNTSTWERSQHISLETMRSRHTVHVMLPVNVRVNPASEADMVGVATMIRPDTPTVMADSRSKRAEIQRLTKR